MGAADPRFDDEMFELVRRSFDDIPEAPPALRERAFAAFVAIGSAADTDTVAPVVRLHAGHGRVRRVDRVLAAAASGGRRVIAGRFAGNEPMLTTAVAEDDDGTLIVTIECATELASPVSMSWTLVDEAGVGEPRTLVTPLVRTRSAFTASYNVGRLLDATAVDVVPAEPLDWAAVDDASLASTLRCVFLGSAERAWVQALASGEVPEWITTAVRRHLDR